MTMKEYISADETTPEIKSKWSNDMHTMKECYDNVTPKGVKTSGVDCHYYEEKAMTDKTCIECGSNSTIEDNGKWLCTNHIKLCSCKKNHTDIGEWDFNQNRDQSIPLTVDHMERQAPGMDIEEEVEEQMEENGDLAFIETGANTKDFRVRWADGGKDDSDKCDSCGSHDCVNPVHTDHYKRK